MIRQHGLVSLTPKTSVLDIYQTILSKVGVRITTGSTDKRSTETNISFASKVKALIPIFGSGEVGAEGGMKAGSSAEAKYEEIPINLELPQHVSDLLKRIGSAKWIILENFHYLNDDVQRQFAFDLRAFQELGVRFVVLGVWREKNRMAQFNGDLLDRLIEVPVEPWTEADFRRVVTKGSGELRIRIEDSIIEAAINASFSSIGVFQELLKGICNEAGVLKTCAAEMDVRDLQFLHWTISIKANDYAARHQRALEAIAAGHTTGGAKGDLPPLFLPFYLVRVILESGFDGVANGMRRNEMSVTKIRGTLPR
jgi:hypothetical protein